LWKRRDGGSECAAVGDVTGKYLSPHAELFNPARHFLQLFTSTADEHEVRSRFGERQRGGFAESAARTGDERHAAIDPEGSGRIFHVTIGGDISPQRASAGSPTKSAARRRRKSAPGPTSKTAPGAG